MPVVEETLIIGAHADDAWTAVTDVESYPETTRNVQSVRVVSAESDTVRRTAWSVLLRGSVLQWVQNEELDPVNRIVTFQQESGDMETYTGHWTVVPLDDGRCSVTLYVDFEIGIPLMADMLNPIAVTALRESAHTMLSGLEKRVPR
ncbi:type II toxin-antitoxin system RatA family toxin [Streptomyces sp. CRN 30]|uniref:type II toxin-antitoxin system RatA family toxin n=1 Tax=Streptomyces sp. CRN 30 TaxID=3075613 RepID=UPI002A8274E1|nr:SRPBCC family protein [Streptomyces sp. CRN 30]